MEDVLKIHSRVCPNFQKNIQISVDGISEAKSNTVSLDVYSSKFRGCRYIYPHRLVRPLKKEYVDNHEEFKKFILDICENDTHIDTLVADNLKRAVLKQCLNHAALYPCEYCFAKGVKFSEKKSSLVHQDNSKRVILDKMKKIENLTDSESKKKMTFYRQILVDIEKHEKDKSRKFTVWPASTANKELRTKSSILDIVCLIENQDSDSDPPSKDDLKGVVGHSILLDIEYFDFVNDSPTEYMHLVCLGAVKRLTELTFNVGLNRTRITKRKLSSTKKFNYLMSITKSTYEFSRRSRDLDFSVYKAEEFRNLILFFFPHVLSCIENDAREKELWLYLTFMIRSCTLPDNEYFNINVNQIVLACAKFYKLYEKLFGPSNCTYSIHVLCCHLLQLRQLGPLTETSAFKFESFYSEIRNAFTPGTPGTLKQIFENILLKRSLSGHTCEKSIHLSNYDTAVQCNSLFYTYINDDVHMYKVLDVIDGEIICNPQGKFVADFNETPELSWSSVGVFKKGATSNDVIKVQEKSIAGKVMKVGEYLITCPENILKEK